MKENFVKPTVVVSKCLGFDSCRYDGQIVRNDFIMKMKNHVDFLPVCPEVEIGLGIPRKPIRIVIQNGEKILYQPATESILTEKMNSFTKSFLNSLNDVDGFILKSRSPSCGSRDVKIFFGFDNPSRTSRGSGLFAEKVIVMFSGLPIEDDGRLENFSIREHFLTKLFALARFRVVKSTGIVRKLIEFHTIHKLLFMGYNQAQMRILGRIVANHKNKDFAKVLADYEKHLFLTLAHPPRFSSVINVLQHVFGGFSEVLSGEEKAFFIESLEEYRDERIPGIFGRRGIPGIFGRRGIPGIFGRRGIPLSVLLNVLYAWSLHHDNTYLKNQVFLRPYPIALAEITDSGKGRKL